VGNKFTPKIRFEYFTKNWEERKVADFSEETFGGGTPKTSNKEYWNGEIPWIQSSDLDEHKVSGVLAKKKITDKGLQNSATKLIPKNSLAIVTRVGVGKISLMQFKYATSQDFISLSNLKVNEWFGVYSLYNLLQKELHNVQGTSIKGITKNELLGKEIIIPTNIEEQTKIGKFFKQLDEAIALHQQEITTLKQTKQGFLQKMFPKEGESVPEVRFPGFSGDWEQRKIREIGNLSAGGDIDKSKLVDNGKYPVLANALTNNGLVGYYNEYKIEAPAVTITGRGDVGHAKARHISFTPVVRLLVLKVNDFDVDFLENCINTRNIFVESTGVPQLTAPQLGAYEIKFPSFREQTSIGSFFKQIDETIALHQLELDALKETKKAFLQKMFV
jgi:type I restriction enzyme, S subunit